MGWRTETWTSWPWNLSKKLSSSAVKKILSPTLSTQGIRNTTLPKGVNRHKRKKSMAIENSTRLVQNRK
jgi:hypothetical protein